MADDGEGVSEPAPPVSVPGSGRPSTSTLRYWRLALLVAVGAIGVVVVRNVFVEAHRVIGWAVAASVVAFMLAPVIARLDRHLPRVAAVLVTFLGIAALAIALITVVTTQLRDEADRFIETAPVLAADVEARDDRFGEFAREIELGDRVAELVDRIDRGVATSSDAVRSAVLAAPAFFVAMILTIFLLVFGPRIVRGALDQLDTTRRRRLEPALRRGAGDAQLALWAGVGQGVVAGVVLGVGAGLADLPAPAVFGLIAGLVAIVPYIGIVVGSLPMLALALGIAPGWQVALLAAVAVGLQLIEAVWWRPLVHRRSLYVGPAVPVVVGLLGYAIYGIGGALYGIAVVVIVLAVVHQLTGDIDVPTPLDEFDDEAADDTVDETAEGVSDEGERRCGGAPTPGGSSSGRP
jgi:predicted PurR-regulated permease PerM